MDGKSAVLKIQSSGKKNEILLNGVPLEEICLSCDIHVDAKITTATLRFLNQGIDIDISNVDDMRKVSQENSDRIR